MLNRRYFLKAIENCWSASRAFRTNIDTAAMNKMSLSTYNLHQRHNKSIEIVTYGPSFVNTPIFCFKLDL